MTVSNASSTPPERRRRPLRLGCALSGGILLIGIVFVGLRLVPAGLAARSALGELRALQAIDLNALTNLDGNGLEEVRGHFAELETDLSTVRSQAGPFLPATRLLGWLPQIGDEAVAASDLLDLGSSAATAGRATMDGAQIVLEAYRQTGKGSALKRVVPALEGAAPYWQEADAALQKLDEARRRLDLSTLDPRLTAQVERLDRYLPLLRGGMALARSAPALLGVDGARTYLLLAQNGDELRPTGGFISGVGLLGIDRGDLNQLDFADSYAIFNPAVDHPLAPPDLERYMGAQMLLLRDVNWSADFPTVAGVAESLYQLDTGTQVDGVVAFDVEAVRRMIGALEPLQLQGYQDAVTAANLTAAMQAMWEAPAAAESALQDMDPSQSDWWQHRKDFMGDLAKASQAKIETGQVDLVKLAHAIYSALQEKHILISLNDSAAMVPLAELGWTGAVQPGDANSLMVVDTNVGWNKVNSLIERSTVYEITPRADGSAEAMLELTYRHQGAQTDQPCIHEPRYGGTYADMAQRCYFNYLRIYVPEGSRLLAAEGVRPDTAATLPGENGTTILASYIVLPPGQTGQVRLRYELPAGTVANDSYHLRLQKQPGTPGWPVTVVLHDPTGSWMPGESVAKRTDRGVELSTQLVTDLDLEFVKSR